jgi:hypothetical protein
MIKGSVKSLGRVHCPIEPEILLADIQGELQIEESRNVQQHIQGCERCYARSAQLRSAYQQVAILGKVENVPQAELRGTVLRDSQAHLRTVRLARGFNVSFRLMLAIIASLVVVAVIFIALVARPFLQNGLLGSGPSQNSLSKLSPIGQGFVFVKTSKLVAVKVDGNDWDISEVIMIDERTGQVVNSLPGADQAPYNPGLGIGTISNIKPVLSPDGMTLLEAAIPSNGRSPTAFAIIDTASRNIRAIIQLRVPSGVDFGQTNPIIRQMWIGKDNATAYIQVDLVTNGQHTLRVLAYSLKDGQFTGKIIPSLSNSAVLVTPGFSQSVLAPDGSAFYTAFPSVDSTGKKGVQVAFLSAENTNAGGQLFIPGSQDFLDIDISHDGSHLYVFTGGNTTLYYIDPSSRTITATIRLAGDVTGNNLSGEDNIDLLATTDDKRILIALDATSNTNKLYNLWTIDVQQQSIDDLAKFKVPVGMIGATSDSKVRLMLRFDGTVQSYGFDKDATVRPWISLKDNTKVVQIIGAYLPTNKLK